MATPYVTTKDVATVSFLTDTVLLSNLRRPARRPLINTTESTHMTTSASFDRDDPPILGANPFVGLTRGQVAAALARVAQRAAVEPGALLATSARSPRRPRACRRRPQRRRAGQGRPSVRRPGLAREPRVPPPHAGLPRRAARRPPARRRGGARPEEPRPRPLRHVPPHRSGRPDQQPAHQPQRGGQGRPDPRAEPGRRRPTPRPRRPSQRRHAVAGRHPPLRRSAATWPSRPGRSCTARRCSS